MTNLVPPEVLKSKLDDDFVKRSVSGCFFFIFMAIILMYVNWAPPAIEGQIPLDYLMNILILANVFRYFTLKSIINNGANNTKILTAKFFSLLNPLLWGVSFAQVLWIDQFHSESSLVVILLTAGFSAGATMTLAADRFVIFTYHAIMLSPLLVGTILLGYTAQTGRSALVAFSVALYLFYNIFQAISIRRQLINTFKFMYFLEKSKLELEESESKLKEESAKVIHSSRLASIGEMAGGIAHEVNNPLAVMTLNIESLRKILEKHKATLEEAAFLKLDKLGRSTQRIRSIVMGLKSFSQQSDQAAFEQVTVERIVNETLEFCNEKIRNSGIDFSVQMEGEALVSARPVQISQIILNLLNNAVDAIKDTKNPKIILNVSTHNDSVYIDVTDSGTGVPEHIRQKLFLPFVTSKEVGKGTGLGLSISRGLARDHGGELELLNGAGSTTFRLILPAVKADSLAASSSVAA